MWDGKVRDMPKIQSPFVRKIINGNYIVTSEIPDGLEWVFNDDSVLATEKLDGTDVSIVIENGMITSIWNRTNRIPFFCKGKGFIIEGLLESFDRGYCELPDGQWFGELIGPKVNGNPYNLKRHIWIPFETYVKDHLRYKSWGKYPKTFGAISAWFEKDLFSLFVRRGGEIFNEGFGNQVTFPEGIVFVHPDGRMAKLRRDMFPWAKEQGIPIHKSIGEMRENAKESES